MRNALPAVVSSPVVVDVGFSLVASLVESVPLDCVVAPVVSDVLPVLRFSVCIWQLASIQATNIEMTQVRVT